MALTEREAYQILGWAVEGGKPNPLILPACEPESQEQDWMVTECYSCEMRGLTRVGALGQGCGICGKPFSYIFG